MNTRIRKNYTLAIETDNRIQQEAKRQGISESRVIDDLVLKHLTDHRRRILNEKREIAKRMFQLDKELEVLDEKDKEKKAVFDQ